MHNLSNSIDALRDAETIIASKLIDENERLSLLRDLVGSIHETLAPAHAIIVRTAVLRRLPVAPKQGWKAEGKQDEAQVAEGSPEAAEGEAEGVEEQAEDFRSLPRGGDKRPSGAAQEKAPKEPKVRRTGKAERG